MSGKMDSLSRDIGNVEQETDAFRTAAEVSNQGAAQKFFEGNFSPDDVRDLLNQEIGELRTLIGKAENVMGEMQHENYKALMQKWEWKISGIENSLKHSVATMNANQLDSDGQWQFDDAKKKCEEVADVLEEMVDEYTEILKETQLTGDIRATGILVELEKLKADAVANKNRVWKQAAQWLPDHKK